MDMAIGEIAQEVGGVVRGDENTRITGVNGVREAAAGDLTFIRAARYLPLLQDTQASAVLIEKVPEDCPIPAIEVAQPELAFAMVLRNVVAEQSTHPTGVHEFARVSSRAYVGANVALAAGVHVREGVRLEDGVVLYPGVYIGPGSVVGPGTVVHANVVIREGVEIGKRCVLHAGVVIGADGFGFAPVDDAWIKIPQVGGVIIGDDVEIGSNSCIDRATFGMTRIGRGTKIDNLVQIGHNVEIGEHCVVAGTVGIAGSAILGNHVRVGAGAGINGHIDIGDGAVIAGWAGVTKSVKPGQVVSGFPAVDHAVDLRVITAQQRTPELIRRMRRMERQIESLEKALHEQAENDKK
jgi:UDP-3-O-[3-hydroxymyristoyl] glucosamine N-acyltransferase